MYKKSDIFPKNLSQRVEKLTDYPRFGSLLGETKMHYFCLYMDDEKIYYQKRKVRESVINTFNQHGKDSKLFNQFRPNDINWPLVLNKYKRPPVETNRKNADTRTGFKIFDDFLVKAHFTFGQRTVRPGTAHVVQTLNVPLLFFLRPPSDFNRNMKHERLEKGYFPYKTLFLYDRRILEPRSCYRIPPGTTYVLFSTQKNFFRLNVVEERYRIPFPHLDPVKNRVTKIEGMYDRPVKTPFIEDDEDSGNEPSSEPAEVPIPENFPTAEVRGVYDPLPAAEVQGVYDPLPAAEVQGVYEPQHFPAAEVQNPETFPAAEVQNPENFPAAEVRNPETFPAPDVQNGFDPGNYPASGVESVPPEARNVPAFHADSNFESVTCLDNLMEMFAPAPPTYYLIENPPPPQKNIVVAEQDFVRGYQYLTKKELTEPKSGYVPTPVEWNEEPLDLTAKVELMDLEEILEMEPADENQMDSLMEELCSPHVEAL